MKKTTAERIYINRINAILRSLDEGFIDYKQAVKDIRHARNQFIDNLDRMERK